MAIVLHHARSKGSTKLVVIGIANHDGDGGAFPSVATLAKYLGRSVRSAQRAIEEAVAVGDIRVIPQGGLLPGRAAHEQPNRYEILVACPADCDRTRNHKVGGDRPGDADDTRGGDADDTPPGDNYVTPPGDADVTQTIPSEPSLGTKEIEQPALLPDPTPPSSGRSSRRRPETELPADWVPLPRHVDYCRTHGLDLETERDRFRAHAAEHQRKARVWDAAFDRWLINAKTYARQRPAGPPPLETEAEHGIWNQVHGGGDNPWN